MRIELQGMDQLSEKLDALARDAPDMLRDLHAQVGERLLQEVRTAVGSSVHDSSGRISRYQISVVGSRGGYTAVRPDKGDTTPAKYYRGRRVAKGALTQWLEGGHTIRKPSGRAKRYRRRIRTTYVDGRGFYARAAAQAEKIALESVEAVADRVAARMGV